MKPSQALVTYLMLFFILVANVPVSFCGEYHASEYPSYEAKQYDYHHHDYHPPPKKAAVDISIPLDFGTLAKLGVLGLTQLKLLMALGKVAGAGLGVSTLALGQLGKIALSVAPHGKGGVAIDIGAPHHGHHSHGHEAKSYSHHEHVHHAPPEKHY